VGRFVAQDVICKDHNFSECEITQLEQKPCLMDVDAWHLTPATLLRHRHLNPSQRLGSADHVISRSQVLHCTLHRISSTSFRNWIASSWWQKRHVRNILFGAPSLRCSPRPYDSLGIACNSRKRSWYLLKTSLIRWTMFCSRNTRP